MSTVAARYRTVVFDCDSTLCRIEGIDELAGPQGPAIAELTRSAMAGDTPLEAVYGRRLALARPSQAAVADLGRRYIETLMPGARETVAALRSAGVVVKVVSGGLRPAVLAVARELGLEPEDVAAVGIRFTPSGDYAGFDGTSPLARAGGKRKVLQGWRLARPVLLVGDGATDLEARSAVDTFAAFTGVARHDAVVAGADVVLPGPSLAPLLAVVFGEPPSAAESPSS